MYSFSFEDVWNLYLLLWIINTSEGQKGTPKRGQEEKRQKMSWQTGPFPSKPILSPAPPINVLWSTEKRETG